MIIKNLKPYKLAHLITTKDEEGCVTTDYSEPIDIMANIYPSSGKLQAELYGLRLNYIMNMLIYNSYNIKETDVVYVDGYRYKVISIKKYSNHSLCEVEKCQEDI